MRHASSALRFVKKAPEITWCMLPAEGAAICKAWCQLLVCQHHKLQLDVPQLEINLSLESAQGALVQLRQRKHAVSSWGMLSLS